MVFSQTSHKARSILKVVDIDITRTNEKAQANGLTGVVTLGKEEYSSVPLATTSSAEVFLKTEPQSENTMFSEIISEVFPDLAESCYIPAKEEQIQTIDPAKLTSERAPNSDTTHTPFSPQEWDLYGVSSPTTSQFYIADNLRNPSNSNLDSWLDSVTSLGTENQFEEQFLDISKLSVVLGDTAPDMNTKPDPWQGPETVGWPDTHNTNTHNQMPFIICQEDSMDTRYTEHIQQEEDNIIVAEYLVDSKISNVAGAGEKKMRRNPLVLNLAPAADAGWTLADVTTPDVLNCVEQLEAGQGPLFPILPEEEAPFASIDDSALLPIAEEYESVSFKSDSVAESEIDFKPYTNRRKRTRRSSDDSDEPYTPYGTTSPRKYSKKRKAKVPIKDKILALAVAQQPTPRRGRPPKRRDSAVSSVCSIDDCASNASSYDNKYRSLRDKNNEASKRSRMNRKLKELQMEQLAAELEEKNKKLQIQVDTLEELTKKLKDTFMAVLVKE